MNKNILKKVLCAMLILIAIIPIIRVAKLTVNFESEKQKDFNEILDSEIIYSDNINWVQSGNKWVLDVGNLTISNLPANDTNKPKVFLFKNGKKVKETTLENLTNNKIIIDDDITLADYQAYVSVENKMYTHKSPLIAASTDKSNNYVIYKEILETNFAKTIEYDTFTNNLRGLVLSKLHFVPKPKIGKNEVLEVKLTNLNNGYAVSIKLSNKSKTQQLLVPLINDYVWIKFDEGFNKNTFLWDDVFISWFMLDTDIEISKSTIDYWYSLQVQDGIHKGLIPREARPENYKESIKNLRNGVNINPLSVHPLNSYQVNNPFMLARLELEIYKKTQDSGRLGRVLPKLINYYTWVENNRKKVITLDSHQIYLYQWQSLGSGMDNSPRCKDILEKCGASDLIAQQAALARDIRDIALILNVKDIATNFDKAFIQLSEQIQKHYFDSSTGFVYDIEENGYKLKEFETAAAIWSLYAHSLTANQAQMFINNYLLNKNKFGRQPMFPSLSRDSEYFDESGNYWRGGIWSPIIWLSYLSLKEYGYNKEALKIAREYYQIFKASHARHGTLYEYYSPTINQTEKILNPGKNPDAKKDFYGWSILPLKLHSEIVHSNL